MGDKKQRYVVFFKEEKKGGGGFCSWIILTRIRLIDVRENMRLDTGSALLV